MITYSIIYTGELVLLKMKCVSIDHIYSRTGPIDCIRRRENENIEPWQPGSAPHWFSSYRGHKVSWQPLRSCALTVNNNHVVGIHQGALKGGQLWPIEALCVACQPHFILAWPCEPPQGHTLDAPFCVLLLKVRLTRVTMQAISCGTRHHILGSAVASNWNCQACYNVPLSQMVSLHTVFTLMGWWTNKRGQCKWCVSVLLHTILIPCMAFYHITLL